MNKFVIIKNSEGFVLRYANVDMHKQMVHKTDMVYGGGMFAFTNVDRQEIMTLYGDSVDFGKPKWDEIEKSKEKIHIDEDLQGVIIQWLNGYDKDWKPIFINLTDKFVFDYY